MPFLSALSSVRIIVLYPSKWKAHAAIFLMLRTTIKFARLAISRREPFPSPRGRGPLCNPAAHNGAGPAGGLSVSIVGHGPCLRQPQPSVRHCCHTGGLRDAIVSRRSAAGELVTDRRPHAVRINHTHTGTSLPISSGLSRSSLRQAQQERRGGCCGDLRCGCYGRPCALWR